MIYNINKLKINAYTLLYILDCIRDASANPFYVPLQKDCSGLADAIFGGYSKIIIHNYFPVLTAKKKPLIN